MRRQETAVLSGFAIPVLGRFYGRSDPRESFDAHRNENNVKSERIDFQKRDYLKCLLRKRLR